MDYIGRTMNICLILFMIFTTGSHCQYYNNRDIILTPNHLKTYPGKVLYYRPREQGAPSEEKPNSTSGGSTAVPWEEVLKETVFLALNDNKTSLQQQTSGSTDNALLLAKRQQKAIYNAPYVGAVDLSAPRFGDIVELAHGRLENEGNESYFFVQQQQQQGGTSELPQSQRNVTALWKVERIRHRDDLRGHRYELKFTIAPTKANKVDEHANEQELPEGAETSEMPGNRTFIVRDEDYPKYFAPFLSSPNAIPMLRKNDQMFERTFFDLVQPQSQYGAYPAATRFFRPAAVAPPQQTITLGQYLVQSLLSGGEAPKYHHHHHHYMPGKLVNPGFFGGLAAATSNRIKFPDSFTGSSHTVPKFYQHIHFQRPSIAPLAPTALPGSYLFHHGKDVHAPAPSNVHQDYTKLGDNGRGNTTASSLNSADAKPTTGASVAPKTPTPPQKQVQQTTATLNKAQQKPQQFPQQQQQQQFHQQVPTTPHGIGQQTPYPSAQTNSLPQQFPSLQQQQQPASIYRPPQVQSAHQQPILIHPHAHPQLTAAGGPAPFIPPFAGPAQPHLIQSIPFYNPQGQMVVNHIPVMANHHVFQMSPSQPIAIPVHLQLIPPVAPAAQLYAPQPPQHQHPQQQQQQNQQQQLQQHPGQAHPQQDGPIHAIPVRIMHPIPNPVHLYSPVNPFLPPLQAQQQSPFHHHGHQHHLHHPIVTVIPKTTSNYQHHQHHPRPNANNQSVATLPTTGHQTHPPTTLQHHHHPQTHSHHTHSYNVIPTVFKFTSSNAIHPQKAIGVGGGVGAGGSATSTPPPPTLNHHHAPGHRYSTPIVQISGPSISPTPAPSSAHQRHRFSTPSSTRGSSASFSSSSSSSSSTTTGSSPSPTTATRPSARFTPAVGQVSGPTVSSTAANHRYAPLPTVPASPAGLREKFTASAFQPAASESKQTSRKLESPTSLADAVGSPSNAVSPKYESFGVENAVTPTAESLHLLSPSSTSPAAASLASSSSLSQSHSSATATASATASTPSFRSTTLDGGSFSYSNFIDTSGAVSVTAKLTSAQTASTTQQLQQKHRSSSASTSSNSSPTTPISITTTQSTFIPPPKTYIQQLGPTIGVKYPPAFKSMPSVTILPPQIETPISSTLKTYQYLNHHDTYDFIPSRVVELAHVKKMNGQKHLKRNKQHKGQKAPPQKASGSPGGMTAMSPPAAPGSTANHHHHVTVTSNKPLRFYPGDGPEYATHRPEVQMSVQLPPPEKEFTMTYYGTPKHNQKVQRPKNFVTPLHPYQGTSTTPLPATLTTSAASSAAFQSVSSTTAPVSSTASFATQDFGRNVTTSTFRSATASSTAHYYKNRHEKSDDIVITTMRPRMILKTIYRQFPGSFMALTSTSTEKPVQKWVPKRPRTSSKSTSGEFSTSTQPSSSPSGSVEQVVASSERDVVTKTPLQSVVVSVRPTLDQQMQRVRASRGRSRYTYRRIPSGNPPPIPTGQQAHQPQTSRTSRMRNSNFNTSTTTTTTTTIKPIAGVTSSVFDSNRIDSRSFEQQERKAEETVMATTSKNTSNEKIKRDASEETTVRQEDPTIPSAAAAEQLTVKQMESKQDPLEVIEPEKEYVMVKANIEPVATNRSNMVFFEASDASVSRDPEEGGRSIGSSVFDELTMSIINHAKAIVNQTEKPTQSVEDTTAATSTTAGGKTIESNEIVHREEHEPELTMESTTTSPTAGSTSAPVTESTVSETIATGTVESDDHDDSDSQTTVAVESV